MPKFKIREPKFAGKLYPADKINLEREIALYLETANIEIEKTDIKGLILPYGDYRIIGGVISKAIVNILKTKMKNIVIIAPTYQNERKGIEIYDGIGFQTPLSIITVDKKQCKKLTEDNSDFCTYGDNWHSDNESGIENSLPFLQTTLGNFNLIPMLVGEMVNSDIEQFAESISRLIDKKDTLLILSLNLSMSKPYETALTLDNELMQYIRQFSIKDLYKKVEGGAIIPSKIDSLSIFMKALQHIEKSNIDVLTYRNSGDITGDKENTSGYFSAIVY